MRMEWNMSWDKYESSYIIAYLPEIITDNIISWGYDNVPYEDVFEDPLDPSFGREKDIHITVLGNIEDLRIENIKISINNEPKLNCILGKIKLFTSNSKYDVLQIEIVNSEIIDLHENLSKSIKNTKKFPSYIPHVTIAYLKKGCGEKYLHDKYFNEQEFMIEELVLSHKFNTKNVFKLGKK